MRRYAVVEKAKDADVIGILVGTLGVGESVQDCGVLHLGANFLRANPQRHTYPSSPTCANS